MMAKMYIDIGLIAHIEYKRPDVYSSTQLSASWHAIFGHVLINIKITISADIVNNANWKQFCFNIL